MRLLRLALICIVPSFVWAAGDAASKLVDAVRKDDLAAFDPSAHRGWSWQFFACAALVLVGDISNSQEWLRRGFMLLAAAKRIQNRAGRHVANSVRFQKVLATAILKSLKWQ